MRKMPKIRDQDSWGSGAFGARRGIRMHNGIDIVSVPGDEFSSFVCGVVTRVGYPYQDDLSFRYVEVYDEVRKLYWRYFYINPAVKFGDRVSLVSSLGTVQKLGDRYPKITEHVHLEIKDLDGNFVDPVPLLEEICYPEVD